MKQRTLTDTLSALKRINKNSIGWNVYETDDGPQPNMSGHVTYTRDAFWKKKTSTKVIKSILDLINGRSADFSLSHNKYDREKEKFVFHLLSDPILMEKTIVLKIHRKQLDEEGVRLLEELRDRSMNRARLNFYKEAKEQYAEGTHGPSLLYKDGRKSVHESGPFKGLVQTEQISMRPLYR